MATNYESQLAELRAKRDSLKDELDSIERTSTGAVARAERLSSGVAKIAKQIDDLRESERKKMMDAFERGELRVEHGSDIGPELHTPGADPWATERMQIKDRARYALEAVARDAVLPGTDGAVERITRSFDGVDGAVDVDVLARWTAVASDPAYLSAFSKLCRDPANGHREFSAPELSAFQRSRSLTRTMSLTDSAGGFMVPMQLDPSIIDTADHSFNQVRQIARTVIATGDIWHGVSSAGVSASWDLELQEVSDDSPSLSQPTIPVYKQQAWVPISIEALMDATNVAEEVQKLLQVARDSLESVTFVTGTGSNQPTGVISALAGVTASNVAVTTADTFSITDVYALDESLPARYRQNSTWLAHRKVYNRTRRFDVSGGSALWAQLAADVPATLLGRPTAEAEAMDSTPSGTNKHFLVVGDFSNYVVADRIGTVVELVPTVFGASNRPIGARGFYMFARTGADSVNDGAFRTLNGT